MILLSEIEKAYNDYSSEIFSYIFRSINDRDIAEDLLQDTFTRLINYSVKKEVHSGNLRALLYTIARSVIIDFTRSSSKKRTETVDISLISEIPSSTGTNPDEKIFDIVDSIIDSLDEPEKNIILLRQNGLTYQEISSITKIAERTLKRRVKSIIEKIRIKLQQDGFFISADTISDAESFND